MKTKFDILIIVVAIAAIGLLVLGHHHASPTAKTAAITNYCTDNTSAQKIIVSINRRQMWACAGARQVYGAAVVTGKQMFAADLTPTGTYKIYDKLTSQDLTGTDTTGSWDDHVNYWLPFLQNQYGTYGFHDAAWRKSTDFGNIRPNSKNASHGCVEVPLAGAKWLYGWAQAGTTEVIEN